jgi:hypothetical protein
MTRNVFAVWIMSLAFAGIGTAQAPASSTDNSSHYTRAQVKELARSAHAPDQYRALATYYGERQSFYLQRAAEEKKEWERMNQNTVSMAAKYPRPVDSARNAYESYVAKALESGALEAKYSRMATPDAILSAR